jgi:hypothetical protein
MSEKIKEKRTVGGWLLLKDLPKNLRADEEEIKPIIENPLNRGITREQAENNINTNREQAFSIIFGDTFSPDDLRNLCPITIHTARAIFDACETDTQRKFFLDYWTIYQTPIYARRDDNLDARKHIEQSLKDLETATKGSGKGVNMMTAIRDVSKMLKEASDLDLERITRLAEGKK